MPKFRPALVLVALLATLAFGAGSAAAKAPCWKTLLNDWYDGRIDGTYPVKCYTAAIAHLPADLQDYSQPRSDLSRALQNAILTLTHKGGGPRREHRGRVRRERFPTPAVGPGRPSPYREAGRRGARTASGRGL